MTNRTYTPDTWVIVEFNHPTYGNSKKILAGWYGGYTTGDSWKLSSGIESVLDRGTHYEVPNTSGSVYLLNKSAQKLSAYTASIYAGFEKDLGGTDGSVRIIDMVTTE